MTRYGVGRGPASARTEGCETERWCKLEMDDFGPGGECTGVTWYLYDETSSCRAEHAPS